MIESKQYDFDAIVVGSGISGGWAAKELTEKGLKVLVLERGKPLAAGSGYLGEHAPNWKLPYQGKRPRELYEEEYPVQSKVWFSFGEANRQFWNNDKQNPYAMDEGKPFLWARADVVGGRSLIWGRQTYRWSEQDFKANATDGHGIPWPVGYKDIEPWYSYVEKFVGINGKKEGLPQLPDSEFQKPMPWFALEETIHARLKKNAPDVTLTNGRVAILTEDLPGRSACHYCGPCQRGCSTGSYFSSQASTLPAAEATGNLTLRANAVVERLEYDKESGKISRVHVIDTVSGSSLRLFRKDLFSLRVHRGQYADPAQFRQRVFPQRAGQSQWRAGPLYDGSHAGSQWYWACSLITWTATITATGPPACIFRAFGISTARTRTPILCAATATRRQRCAWTGASRFNAKGFGADLKNSLRKPGPWIFALAGFTECLPRESNRMYLSKDKVDRFGIPQVVFDFEWSENEINARRDAKKHADRLLKAAGAVLTVPGDDKMSLPGEGIHEMGTARMGADPATSVLNAHNQAHDVPNLFITDGSFMTSASCVNPSLTYMAFTARACDYAVKQIAQGVL